MRSTKEFYVIFNLAHDYCNIDLERVPWHKTCDIIVFMFQNWQYIYINKMEIDLLVNNK
jgi:hypothetical protein